MNQYKKLNNIVGWVIFLIALATYTITMEKSASWWDCGEFIATAYKLQVGHPPGASLFAMLGKVFTLLAGGNLALVPVMVNFLSALASAFTILFLFWTITAVAKKLVLAQNNNTQASIAGNNIFLILGAGALGALCYTFSDSFWFSAVEGEVYALSSFFTAVVFWAAFKWDEVADQPYADRWLILIAYLMGLSTGVHLLNLLTIPAIGLIYYFRRYQPSNKGIIVALAISGGALMFIQYGIIPGTVSIAAFFEKLFTNGLGMSFGTGFIAYVIFLVALFAGLIYYSVKKVKPLMNQVVWAVILIIVGYSSSGMIIIRSQANTPLDENDPENAYSLISYFNREQYGDRPLFFGHYFTEKITGSEDGAPIYIKAYVVKNKANKTVGTYTIERDAKEHIANNPNEELKIVHEYVQNGNKPVYIYGKNNSSSFFPRMWSTQAHHIRAYQDWGGVNKNATSVNFAQNMRFLIRYQLGWQYFRYFMWNFSGRESEPQGNGEANVGHWITGIPSIDAKLTNTPQKNLPDEFKNNPGRNKYYAIPFIIGLIGLFFHFKKDKNNALVIFFLFFLTGIAIVLYLNPTPYQPRERDYAYVGSFYAFAIWVGLGFMAIVNFLKKFANEKTVAMAALPLLLIAIPGNMLKENWNDHNRSNRTIPHDFAYNYLNSCAPNAILFTNGDNDTFPLWYLQEVEGIRTDVRVVNLSLLNTDWYITQMKRKAYDGEPVPFGLKEPQYRQGTRDYAPMMDNAKYFTVQQHLQYLTDERFYQVLNDAKRTQMPVFPSKKFILPVDSAKVIASGIVPKGMEHKIAKELSWEVNKSHLQKNEIMIIDLLANFNWERPIYFSMTVGESNYLGLQKFFQQEGLAFRLMPYETKSHDGQTGEVNTDIMYENMMNVFKWGNMNGGVFLDETSTRMMTNFRGVFFRLASALAAKGDKDKAIEVLDKTNELLPDAILPYNYYNLLIADLYSNLGANDKAKETLGYLIERQEQLKNYYEQFKPKHLDVKDESDRANMLHSYAMQILSRIDQAGSNPEFKPNTSAQPTENDGTLEEQL